MISSLAQDHASDHPHASRNATKLIHACDSCRARKTKCDGQEPCGACVEHRFSCAYRPRARASGNPKRRERRSLIRREALGLASSSAAPTSHTVGAESSSMRQAQVQQAGAFQATSQNQTSPTDYEGSLLVNPLPDQDGTAQIRSDSPDSNNSAADAESLREINVHTMGQEFYGPSAVLTFLSRLRLKARRAGIRPYSDSTDNTSNESLRHGLSLVSYMYNPDPHDGQYAFDQLSPRPSSTSDIAIEKECVRLYFQHLHYIHPVLDKTDYWHQCERIVWSGQQSPPTLQSFDDRTFLPLHDAVVAVGAIIAAEDDLVLSLPTARHGNGNDSAIEDSSKMHQAHALAARYFARAKSHLSDMFEMCSFNGTLTLLLMAIYCQNALQQHNCYMYTGMAVRAALAMGIPMTAASPESPAARLWWAIYAVEIEMSLSAGRASALAEPSCYVVSMPPTASSMPESFISYMVPFAALLNDTCRKVYNANPAIGRDQKSQECLLIDQHLQDWKTELDLSWDTNSSPLLEPEWRTKQKLVCNLRFWNARILLHRPFLLSLTASPEYHVDESHIRLCVEASQATIAILYDAFSVRPWFRTWWYNSTYVLYATMVLLYMLLSGTKDMQEDQLLLDARRGLKVLEAMKSNAVAARCAAVIVEILDITEAVLAHRHRPKQAAPVDAAIPLPKSTIDTVANENMTMVPEMSVWDEQLGSDLANNFDTLPALWNLVDNAFLDSLLDFQPAREHNRTTVNGGENWQYW